MKSYSLPFAFAALMGTGLAAPDIDISGMVTDSAGLPLAAANVRMEKLGLTAITDQNGLFTLKSGPSSMRKAIPASPTVEIKSGKVRLSLSEASEITVTTFGIEGHVLASRTENREAGSHLLTAPNSGTGVRFIRVQSARDEMWIRAFSLEGVLRGVEISSPPFSRSRALAKASEATEPYVDEITVTKAGYLKSYLGISTAASNKVKIKMMKEGSTKFSFFVTSLQALQDLSGSPNGFGGDLRIGETGLGAGLRGADKICVAVAERSLPSSGNKGWRAFLSVKSDSYGNQVNANGSARGHGMIAWAGWSHRPSRTSWNGGLAGAMRSSASICPMKTAFPTVSPIRPNLPSTTTAPLPAPRPKAYWMTAMPPARIGRPRMVPVKTGLPPWDIPGRERTGGDRSTASSGIRMARRKDAPPAWKSSRTGTDAPVETRLAAAADTVASIAWRSTPRWRNGGGVREAAEAAETVCTHPCPLASRFLRP